MSVSSSSSNKEKDQLERQAAETTRQERLPRNFWPNTIIRDWVPEVLDILARAGISNPTIRRVFYTLAQNYADFPKTSSAYQNLSAHLTDVRLRRGKYKDWDGYDYRLDTFEDESRPDTQVPRYRRPRTFVIEHVFGLMYVMENYDPNIWEGQKDVIEIMIEKQGMVGSVKKIAKPIQVAVFANTGNDSPSHQYEQYQRWKDYQAQGKNVHVGYLGDLDAWGEHMDKRDYVKKILQMIEVDIARGEEPLNWNWTKEDWDNDDPYNIEHGDYFEHHYDPDKPDFTFERLGLTEQQVNDYNLMKIDVKHLEDIPIKQRKIQHINFAKRHHGFVYTVELDGVVILHEDKLVNMIEDFRRRWYDDDKWQEVKDELSEEAKEEELRKRVTFKKLARDEWENWKNDQLWPDDSEGDTDLTPISDKDYKGEDGYRYVGGSTAHYDAKHKIKRRTRKQKGVISSSSSSKTSSASTQK